MNYFSDPIEPSFTAFLFLSYNLSFIITIIAYRIIYKVQPLSVQ